MQLDWLPHSDELIPWRSLSQRMPSCVDIVHANSWHAAFLRTGDVPLIAAAHAYSEASIPLIEKGFFTSAYHRFVVRPRIRRAILRSARVIAVSQTVAEHYRKNYSANQVQVVPNWLSPNEFPVQVTACKERIDTLLFAGRAGANKGSDLLPALAMQLDDAARLLCTLRRSEWPSPNVPSNVDLVGPLPRDVLLGLIGKVTAVVVPSRSEGFSQVALEAMAHGTPVIACSGTGVQEVIGTDGAGILVEQQDVEGIGHAFSALRSRQVWMRVSEMARDRAWHCFREEAVIPKLCRIYLEALG